MGCGVCSSEEDKPGRRGQHSHSSGPLSEFREKAGFRPNIKLEYVDDDGRPLCPKEAFRYLSHKFHGKGPGKNKQEKRIKKAVQEGVSAHLTRRDYHAMSSPELRLLDVSTCIHVGSNIGP